MSTRPSPRHHFYIDEFDDSGKERPAWIHSPIFRIVNGISGVFLLGLGVESIVRDGVSSLTFLGPLALGLVLVLQAALGTKGDPPRWEFIIDAEGLTLTGTAQRHLPWADVVSVRETAQGIDIVPASGEALIVPYSGMSYVRVQQVKAAVRAEAEARGLPVT